MLIPLDELIRNHALKITGVIHVGAHLGEEADAYELAGIKNVIWIEGNPDLIAPLAAKVVPLGHQVVNALVGAESSVEKVFHITNNGQSSSVLEFGTHTIVSPDVHFTHDIKVMMHTIDDIMDGVTMREDDATPAGAFNFMNLDLQGYELEALKGAKYTLPNVDYIYTEVNHDELYVGCARIGELDDWLGRRGFKRVATAWAGASPKRRYGVGWGDALYVRTP